MLREKEANKHTEVKHDLLGEDRDSLCDVEQINNNVIPARRRTLPWIPVLIVINRKSFCQYWLLDTCISSS